MQADLEDGAGQDELAALKNSLQLAEKARDEALEEMGSLQSSLEERAERAEADDAADKASVERIHELESALSELEDSRTKSAKEIASLKSELEDVKKSAERSASSAASGDTSWTQSFYDEVNDAISEWRNNSRTLQGQVMDLVDEQYIGESEMKPLIQEISQSAEMIAEQSESVKKLIRSYRSHIE